MEGNGITGFNPERVQGTINGFLTAFADVQINFSEAHKHLFSEDVGLGKIWCSPNAVDFYNYYSVRIDDAYTRFDKDMHAYLFSIRRAYNIIASRHGLEPIDIMAFNDFDYGVSLQLPQLHERHPQNNSVGINRQLASMVLATYKQEMENCFKCFDGIPTTIEFYDEEGSQQDAYRLSVETHKEKFIELFREIVTAIEKAIGRENDNSRLAKEQATQTLNG